MNYSKRLECLSKIVNMIDQGESIVVCGTGFYYSVFKEYLLSEVLERLDTCIQHIEWVGASHIEFFSGSQLIIFDVERPDEIDSFVEQEAKWDVNLMLMFEPQLGFLKEQYNTRLLPIMLEKPGCRIQIVRA